MADEIREKLERLKAMRHKFEFGGVIGDPQPDGTLIVTYPPERAGEIVPVEPESLSQILARLQSPNARSAAQS